MADSDTTPVAPSTAPRVPAPAGPQPDAAGIEAERTKREDERQSKKAKKKRPALIAFFPKLRWPDTPPTPGIDPILYCEFPDEYREHLGADWDVLQKHLAQAYVEEDAEAGRAQNEYRRDQVVLIIGGVIATGLAALPGELGWVGWKVIAAIWAAFLAAWASRSRDLNAQERWRTSRLKAELLRGEYFLFMSGAPPYGDPGCRVRNLRRRVAEIRSGGAP